MEPITWEWIANEHAKSLREWEALKERMQPHLASLKKYFELPERRILYQVDDAIRNDILEAVNKTPDEQPSTITVQLGAHWTPPTPGTPWLNPWPDRKFLIEGLCSHPAYFALCNAGCEKDVRKFHQRFRSWWHGEISDMIEDMWLDWIKKMFPKDIRSIRVEHDGRHRGHVIDLVYSVHVEFTCPPPTPTLYEPLAPHEGRKDRED